MESTPGAATAWRRVRSNVFPYAALADDVHWVVLRLNEFPEHPLYTFFMNGERICDLDVLGLGSHPEFEPLTPGERQEVLTLMRGLAPYGSEAGQPCDSPWCCDGLTDDIAAMEAS